MSWLTLSLTALFTYVAYDIVGRYCATRAKDPRAFAFIFNGLATLFAPLIFLVDKTMPQALSWQTIALTVIGLSLWGLNARFEYFAKKHTEISTFTIITKIAPVGTFFLAVIFLREPLTLSKISGIALMLIANYLLFVGHHWRDVISKDGLKYSMLISGVVALAWFFDAVNIKNWGVGTFSLLSFSAGSLICALFPTLKWQAIKVELQRTPVWQIAVLALLNLAAYALQLKALSLGPASNVMPIVTSTSPFVVFLGLMFLGENDFLARKFIAAAIAVFGIYLMR